MGPLKTIVQDWYNIIPIMLWLNIAMITPLSLIKTLHFHVSLVSH